jgi:NadR type nicotinamide-nucleotide adenylyltransferase
LTKKNALIKIAVVGPESTGKSNLCKALAKLYQTKFVPEFAREYLTQKNAPYTLHDIIYIHQQQILSETILEKEANTILFCDTTSLVNKIWLAEKFNIKNEVIESDFNDHSYDLYLLCAPDMPWEYDPLRENENDRERLFDIYKKSLTTCNKPFEIITGLDNVRLHNAKNILEKYFPELQKE